MILINIVQNMHVSVTSCYMSIMLYLLRGNILSPFQTMSWVVWSVNSKGIWGLIT